MRKAIYWLPVTLCSVYMSSAVGSVYTDFLGQELDQCRADYKTMAENLQKKIDEKIKQGSSIQSIKSQTINEYQNQLNAKAQECKTIKQNLEEAPILEEAILSASSNKKVGPVLRCLHLGQSKKDVLQCARSLGYKEYLFNPSGVYKLTMVLLSPLLQNKSTYDHPLFVTYLKNPSGGEIVVRLNGEDFTAYEIAIKGAQFWGAKQLDKTFLNAMQENYEIAHLIPQLEPTILGMKTWYYHQDDGWKISVYPENMPPKVMLIKTTNSSDLKF